MFGYFIAIFLTLPALFFWLIEEPLSIRFVNNVTTFTSLGQIFGLVGACLLIYSIFFSIRPKFLEDKFGGLDKIYRSHHFIGIAAWIFLLAHPITLSFVQIKFSLIRVFRYFLPGNDFAINLGIFALFLMVVLLVLTLFWKPTYKIWKFTHEFLELSLVLGVLHSFLVGSDISRFLPLKIYMLAISLVGVSAAIYQVFLAGFLKRKYSYRVKNVLVKNNVADIELFPLGKEMLYENGQFAFFQFLSGNIPKESHPFSVAPAEGNSLRIVVKLQGDYTNLLKNLNNGTKVIIEGPYGKFAKTNNITEKQIWLAGGIGIVPFLSMAKNAPEDKTIDLYYLVKNHTEALYLKELYVYAQKNPNIHLIPFYSEDLGHINPTKIEKISGNILQNDYFICGPKKMALSLIKSLKESGVKQKLIHYELFEY